MTVMPDTYNKHILYVSAIQGFVKEYTVVRKHAARGNILKHSMLEGSSNLPQCSLRSFGSPVVYAIIITPYINATN
jgi:hypothetical protein